MRCLQSEADGSLFLHNEYLKQPLLDLLKTAAENGSEMCLFSLADQLQYVVKEPANALLFLSRMWAAIE